MIPLLLISDDSKKIKKHLDKILTKNHLLIQIKPEEKEYSINQIKSLFRETGLFNKKLRVYLLENFHLSSQEAQNSFLKLLEEPPTNVLFVLTTDNEEKLLPTIRSRTKIIYLEKKRVAKLATGSDEVFKRLISSGKFSFPKEQISVDDIIIFFKERLKTDKKAVFVIKEALKLKSLLEKNNLNAQLTIDHLLIFIWKTYNIK